MEQTNLDVLLQRYLEGKLTPKEKAKFEAWLEVVKTKYKTDLVLTPEDEDRLFEKITNDIDNVSEIHVFEPEYARSRSLLSNRWFQIAAQLLLLVAASYLVWYFVKDSTGSERFAAAVEKQVLPDGTIVWLKEGSSLNYEADAMQRTRHVELKGEGLFEVAKDPAHPFTIACGKIMVKVIGTSFSLKTDRDDVQLKVLTGKVNLTSLADLRGIDVMPSEKVIYSVDGTVKKTTMAPGETSALIAGTEYDMLFRDAVMDQVLERIARKFHVKVKVENNQMYKCHITADLTDNSLDASLQMLSEVIHITYTIEKNVVVVSGGGCN
jgi:transmembrane sensor